MKKPVFVKTRQQNTHMNILVNTGKIALGLYITPNLFHAHELDRTCRFLA